jgi:hypothetical protein
MWNAQEASKACFTKASTDIQIAFCTVKAQSTDFAQALAGRPAPNRNPSTAPEVAGDVGKKAVDGLTAVGVAKAVASGVESATDVQAQAPVVVRPEVVRPEVVLVP